MLTVLCGGIVVGLDTTMTNVALRAFLVDLRTDLPTAQWIGTGYLLAMTMVIPVTGWAVDRWGERRLWIVAVAAFLVGSLLCGLAGSADGLIAARVVQGAAAGMILPLSQTILARSVPRERLGRAMSALGVPAALAPVLGPVLGGLLVDHLGWRWIFLVNCRSAWSRWAPRSGCCPDRLPQGAPRRGWTCSGWRCSPRGARRWSTAWRQWARAVGSPIRSA